MSRFLRCVCLPAVQEEPRMAGGGRLLAASCCLVCDWLSPSALRLPHDFHRSIRQDLFQRKKGNADPRNEGHRRMCEARTKRETPGDSFQSYARFNMKCLGK